MKFDDIKKLQQKKYREEFGHFLVEGEHLVLELQKAAIHNTRLQNSELYVTEKYAHWQTAFTTHVISARQMAQISETKTPQGIVALVPMAFGSARNASAAAQKNERAIYLHEIQDPGNLGTILRTLAWFGGFRCLLSGGSVDPFNAKVVRASMGAIFHVPMQLDVELESLADAFERIAVISMSGKSINSPGFGDFHCYLFGNEARGVPTQVLNSSVTQTFTIPGGGAIESLNLASAVNIVAFELNR